MKEIFYFSRRAQEARKAALQTGDPKAREAHLQFAAAYDAKVSELTALKRGAKLRIVFGGERQHRA